MAGRTAQGKRSAADPAPRAWAACRVLRTACAAALLLLWGCSTHSGPPGNRGVSASYGWRTLSADLPGSVRVPAVMAAAQSALAQRGYSIVSKAVTSDHGRIEARPPHGDPDEAVTIVAEVAGGSTRGTVRVGEWGDEAASRAILDAMLVRLGL